MREDVHLVWKNCLVFNGHDNAIYLDCKKLADRFDNEFRARIRAPRHRERICVFRSLSLTHSLSLSISEQLMNQGQVSRNAAALRKNKITSMNVCP
jgi:hypothetical protein